MPAPAPNPTNSPLIDWMNQQGYPVTRSTYIAFNFTRDLREPWTAENEAMLPEQLQDWSLFDLVDGEYIYKGD